ncbi:NnrS family protein [Azospirillum brasilense]|uniref:NnrS family protein n=1 Tax=Azospirillum argentinense TaxID=2970906 RepID=UPI00190EC7ED|nr:NnrS family protein [Azospirillum argentinense]MBK3802144.1 NnrS family protein [Azospirillum argentinense]
MPFRPFFLLTALDALLAVGLWVPALLGWDVSNVIADLPGWHGRALLFGTLPAMMAGFLRTALPRWTKRPLVGARLWPLLVPLWLAGRALSPWVVPAHAPFLAALALLVTAQIAAARDRRNAVVAALVGALAGAALCDAVPSGLALSLGLVMVLGGRIAPSLTATHLGLPSKAGLFTGRPWFERAAALAAAGALAGWLAEPSSGTTAAASLLAALMQTARLLQWRGWRTLDRPSVLAVHAAYACVPLGFAAVAASPGMAVHLWTVGALGLMGFAVMSSMIRKHAGNAFGRSAVVTGCYALIGFAVVLRAAAAVVGEGRSLWLLAAAGAWGVAVVLFLAAFGRLLVRGRS